MLVEVFFGELGCYGVGMECYDDCLWVGVGNFDGGGVD